MAIVGSAEIVVRAITNKVKDDIQKGLRDAQPVIAQEGQKAGEQYAKGFGRGTEGNLGKAFEDSLRRSNLGGMAEGEGHNTGSSFIHGVEDEIESGGRDIEKSAANLLNRAGKSGGDGFFRGFLNSDFGKSAGKASEAFTQIIGAGNLLGPSIAGLIGLLGSAAAGLFAMAGAAAQAAGALAVIPGTISVAAQAFGVLKLAFSGVGNAISAGFKAADQQVATTTSNALSNARAIADARLALSRAQADARTAEADATLRVAQAEQDVGNAQRQTLIAQKGLNAAREEGVKQLRDLAFQAEDAGLAEQQAGLDLQDARKKLEEAQNLPPDDQARVAAELAFKQADLAYREAKARNQDLQEEQTKAAKKGVDGTDAVVAARQKIADAQKNEANAEKDLASAREARQKTQLQNARSIQDAQLRLSRALQDQATNLNKASTAASAYQTALAKLSPPARTFVEHLVGMKSKLDDLKAAAGQELFPKLTTAVDLLANNLLPSLEDEFKTTGGLVGDLGLQFAQTISQGEGLKNVQDILAGNNAIMKVFTERTKTGRSTLGNFVIVATRLLKVIQPITTRFAEWIKHLSVLAERATDTGKETGKMTKFLEHAGDVAAQLGRIFGNIGRALLILFDGSKKSGQGLLDSFEKATKKLDKFLTKLRDNGSMGTFFKRAAFNLRALGHLFDLIFVQLVKISDSKSPGKFAKSLEPAVKNFGDIGAALSDASPAIGDFVEQVSLLIKGLTNSGQIETFLKTLTVIAKVLSDIVNNPIAQKLLLVAGTFFAVHRAVAFALKPIGFFFKAMVGGPRNALNALTKFRDGFSKFTGFIGKIKSDGFSAAFKSLKDKSDESKDALEEQMGVDELKKKSLNELGDAAEKAATHLKHFRDAAAPLPAEMEAIGAETAAGLTAGFEANSTGFIEAMTTVAREAVQAVKIELGIASPSKVFYEIGQDAGKGYVDGIESEQGKARAAGAELGAASATGAESTTAGGALAGGTGAGPTSKLASTAEKDAAKLEKSGGKMSKLFGGLGKALGGLTSLFLPFEIGLEGIGAAIGAAIVPILLIIAAVAAFVGMFILLYKQSPQFKKFIDGIVGKLKDLGHWFKDVVLPIVVNFAKWIGEKFVALVVPPLNAFFGVVNDVLPKIGKIFGDVFHAIGVFYDTVLKPVINALIDIIQFLWKFVIKPYLKLIQLEWKILFAAIKLYWKTILHPVINALIDIITFLWKNVFRPYFNLIGKIVGSIFRAIKQVWDNVLHPVFNAIKSIVTSLFDTFKSVFDKIKGLWDDFTSKFTDFKNGIGDVVGNIVDAFKSIGTGVKNAFEDVFQKLGQGIKNDIAFLNKYLIGGLNKVTSKFGITLPDIPIPQFAQGGRVRGPGGSTDDRILAALSNNEFVVKAEAAKRVGFPFLESLNDGALGAGGFSIPHPHIPGISKLKDLAGDAINGVENVGEDIAKKGLGKVLHALVTGAEKLMQGAGMGRGSFINDLFYGILDKLGDAVENWGGEAAKGLSKGGKIPANVRKSGKWAFPVAGAYTYNGGYPYGAHPSANYWHTGSDFPAAVGTPLVAMGAGMVNTVRNLGDRSYGRYVTIDYGTFQTLYAHMNAFASGLRSGQMVRAGSPIGQVGWYGNVLPKSPAGAHLHLEVSPAGIFGSMSSTLNPLDLLRRLGFKFAKGGVVSPRDGGMLGVIGEAGHHERVEPLDSEGFSKRDRAILDMIQQAIGQRGGDTLIVNPSQGMDEMELAAAVARRMQFRRRTGT